MSTPKGTRQRKTGGKAPQASAAKVSEPAAAPVEPRAGSKVKAALWGGAAVLALLGSRYPKQVASGVNWFLGVEEDSRKNWLPGATPQGYIGFEVDEPRQQAVVQAFQHAWSAYERDAMGMDEYHPISKGGSLLTAAGGIGYTVVDSLDTMLIMGLKDEYARARDWVQNELSFDRDGEYSTFETTIRVLGGLLSAYHLSGGDKLYLDKAIDLGDRMLPIFEAGGVGLPTGKVNLGQRKGVVDMDNNGYVSTAEATTLQLEFKYLSALTEDDVYWRKAERVMAIVKANTPSPPLATIYINPMNGKFHTSAIRLGSRGDSYYEYLIKQYIQTNGTEDVYRSMYSEAIDAVTAHLVHKSMTTGHIYTSELIPQFLKDGGLAWRSEPKQDFLVCFMGGTLMLGATRAHAVVDQVSIPPKANELTEQGQRDWKTGVALIETCMHTHDTLTGLAPEIAHFRTPNDGLDREIGGGMPRDWYIKGAKPGAPSPYDARYMLRPETVESLFYAFRLTGDIRYRNHGWNIFRAILKHCRIPSGGFATVLNVDQMPVKVEDKMETFFMSETLKYLYLLFSDNQTIPLSEYVFNTEAHPLPIFRPTIRTGFS
ncbi:glycoside hydrolase family 47 protein [Peniophora sp. CONT]|nr:glycoside hydrolase family 47 protein [Peniophora sp. CONT]